MDYDEFEETMLAAGWDFDEIEEMWQAHLQADQQINNEIQPEEDDYSLSDYYEWMEEERNELMYSLENPDYPIDAIA